MDFDEGLKHIQTLMQAQVASFFQEKRPNLQLVDRHLVPIVDELGNFTLRGGKRLRAFLCWLGYSATCQTQISLNNPPPLLVSTMVGLELFQSYMLIHDDIIDNDSRRRGGATLHLALAKEGSQRDGVNLAILAGDLIGSWADEQFLAAQKPTLQALYETMKKEVIEGQLLDVLRRGGKPIDKAKVDERKTAWYTIIRPLQLGAMLTGSSGLICDAFASYGLPVGLLFQLKDDFLDKDVSATQFDEQKKVLEGQAKRALEVLPIRKDHIVCFRSLIEFVTKRSI